MINRGDLINRDKLNGLISDTANKTRVVGGGKILPNNNPAVNQIIVSGVGGGGGGITVKFVAKLPPINTTSKTPRFVFWCSEETGNEILGEPGTGDDQVWAWWPNAPYYVPVQRYTMKSGFPEVA